MAGARTYPGAPRDAGPVGVSFSKTSRLMGPDANDAKNIPTIQRLCYEELHLIVYLPHCAEGEFHSHWVLTEPSGALYVLPLPNH